MFDFIKSLFKQNPFENLESTAFLAMIKATPNAVVIDVRTPAETTTGMVEGAVNLDVQGSGFADAISKFDKEKPYFIYCRSGVRSANACRKMHELGFSKLYNLSGGYLSL